jgi:two-component system, cell cycle sensor histidine kinase and response regulator CckA
MTLSLRLLLIDDNAFDADLLRHNLDSIPNLNIDFEWVNEFHSGLETVCENRHDICLIDNYLGPQSGADLIRQALQRGCNKPLILYSGKEDVGLGLKAISWGAVDYIVKDHIDPFMLEKTLRGIIQREQILQESAKVKAKMYDSQRLESLGLMASGIAHDFNNILGIIMANSELAVGMVDEHSAVHRYLSSIRLATERAAELTNQMLAYSGRGRSKLKTLDLRELAHETLDFCRVGISRKIALECSIESRLPPVHGDPTQIRQVLMNLIQNAADSIAGEGTVRITSKLSHSPANWAETCQFVTPLVEGRYAVLCVSDDGCGINPEQLGRIFDPFFTTKSTGRGLGLAAVLGIVKSHKGSMRVTSQLGVGTAFEVWLPVLEKSWQEADAEEAELLRVAEAKPSAAAPAVDSGKDAPGYPEDGSPEDGIGNPSPRDDFKPGAPTPHSGSHSGYVLVVDDENAILQALEVMLQARGYQTRLACDAEEALMTLGSRGTISAAVLDIMLAGRSGVELFRDLRAKVPDLPVVFISGYNESEALLPLVKSGEVQYLRKPFSSTQLMEALETAYRSKHPRST